MLKEDKIKRVIFFCGGNYFCNLKCEYCYLDSPKPDKKFCTPKELIRTFSKKSLGGCAFFNFVTLGETLLCDENIEAIKLFLEEGHVVNVVTNLTYSKNLEKLLLLPEELKSRLIIHASLHYLELKKKNLLDEYFNNLQRCKEAGVSFHMDLTVYEKYMPVLEEIKEVCLLKTGLLPNITIALDKDKNWMPFDFYNEEAHKKIVDVFEAKELDIQRNIFFDKEENKPCMAGRWSLVYYWSGRRCTACNGIKVNIDTPFVNSDGVKWLGGGDTVICPFKRCFCGEIFLTWGLLPERNDIPTFFEFYLKEKGFYSETVKKLTDVKLSDNNR